MARTPVTRSEMLHAILGAPVQDPEEETFLCFSQEIPSNNLGFVDANAETVEIEIDGVDYTVQQSPGLLHSNIAGGTTGAVLWKVTPRLAKWLASSPSLLSDLHALHPEATIVELGCGLTGLIGQVLSRFVACYILTDQASIVKHLKTNLLRESLPPKGYRSLGRKNTHAPRNSSTRKDVLKVLALDWETDAAENLNDVLPPSGSVDLLILCDCVYNEYLVSPLVQTCRDICRLGSRFGQPTVLLIAQQLRSDAIFEMFLATLMKEFDIWRIPDEQIVTDLSSNSGYAVHIGLLRAVSGT